MVRSGRAGGWIAVSIASFAGLLLASGCGDIFGFERSGVIVECIHNSDCADNLVCLNNFCTSECKTTKDCQPPAYATGLVCSPRSHLCVAADAGIPVASPEASPGSDANAEASSPCGDTTSDVNNCGSCGNVCTGEHVHWACTDSACVADGCEAGWGDCNGNPADGCEDDVTSDGANCSYCGDLCESTVCQASHCLAVTTAGPAGTPSPAAANIQINSDLADSNVGELFGIQFSITQQSVLLSIGIVTSYGGPQGDLGLYQDVGGHPTTLLASTGEFKLLGDPLLDNNPKATVVNAMSQVTLQPGAYWILGQWDQSVFVQLAEGQLGCVQGDPGCVPWYLVPQTFGPVPSTAPPGQYPWLPEPIMYVTLAQ